MSQAPRRVGLALALIGALASTGTIAGGRAHAREPQRREREAAHSRPGATAASVPTVLVLPVVSEGLTRADAEAVERSLAAAFDHDQLVQIPATGLERCADEPCLRELGRAHEASHVVQVEVHADGRDYSAALTVVTVAAPDPASIIDAGCEICGVTEFRDRVAARAVVARDLILAAPQIGRLELRGAPSDAWVRIDGQLRGRAPLVTELPAGAHELRLDAAGYYPKRLPIESHAGVTQRLQLTLEPKPLTRWQRPSGWALLGAGAASLTVGLALIAVDGSTAAIRCRNAEPGTIDADGDCRWLRHTRGAGIAGAVLGATSAVVGASLLVVDAQRRRARVHVGVGGSPVGGRVAVQLHF